MTDLTIAPLTVQEAEIINKAEFAAAIAEINERYSGLVVLDKAEAKKDRAEINRVLKQIDDTRKAIKKKYDAPFKAFENELREITMPLRITADEIDDQIKTIEAAERQERRKKIEEMYADIPTDVPLYEVWSDKWLNASVSMARIKDEMLTGIISRQQVHRPAPVTVPDPQPTVTQTATGVPVFTFSDSPKPHMLTISATEEEYNSILAYLDALGVSYMEV